MNNERRNSILFRHSGESRDFNGVVYFTFWPSLFHICQKFGLGYVKLIMAVSSKKRFSIALYQGVSCFGKKCDPENTAIFNFTQNGTSQPVVSNSSNASDWKRKIMYPLKISAKAGIQYFSSSYKFSGLRGLPRT